MTLPISVTIGRTDLTPTTRYTGWRVLHAAEGGYTNPVGMPAVRPAINAPSIDFTRDMQLRSYELNEGRISKDKWRVVWGSQTMLTNEQSWPEQVCRDYVNGLDLNAEALPKIMKGIICGGMFLRNATQQGAYLVCEPGISAIDVNKPIPDVATIVRNNWYFRAVTSGERVFNILGSPVPILIPYFLEVPVRYPIAWFERWDQTFLPDPTVFYRR